MFIVTAVAYTSVEPSYLTPNRANRPLKIDCYNRTP